MRVDKLERYERPACALCGVMAPEVQLPVGDGCKPACWLCAHDATEHADGSKCTCTPTEIYPADVIARRMPLQPVTTKPKLRTVVNTSVDGQHKMVQTFEEIRPGVLKAVGLTLRPFTRGERISRTFHRKNHAVTK